MVWQILAPGPSCALGWMGRGGCGSRGGGGTGGCRSPSDALGEQKGRAGFGGRGWLSLRLALTSSTVFVRALSRSHGDTAVACSRALLSACMYLKPSRSAGRRNVLFFTKAQNDSSILRL